MTHPATCAVWPTLPQPRELAELKRTLGARDARLAAAVALAERLHAGQLRDGSDTPYLFHPLSVATLGVELGLDDVDDLITAVLHDTLEDTDLTAEALERDFGRRVATQVALLTKSAGSGASYFERLRSAPVAVRLVKAIDRLHNLLTIPEERKSGYVAETRERILPLLGDTVIERRLHQLLVELAAAREAGDRPLTGAPTAAEK